MSEDELRALTDREMRHSIGYGGGKLAEQRRKAEYYYLGLPKGDLTPPEISGRSSVVSPDIRNTIEAMMPQLMVKFVGGNQVVEFEPTKPGPVFEKQAKDITDYLNYIYFKRNPGHNICYTVFKDALIQKVGIVKVWWDNRDIETREEYKGLSDIELSQIEDDEELTVTSHSAYPDEDDAEERKKALDNLQQQLQQAMQQQPQQPPQGPQPGQPPQGPQQGQPGQPGQPPGQPQQPPPPSPVQQIQQQIDHINSIPPVMLHDIECKRTKKGGKITIENVPPEEFLISRRAKSIADASFVGHRVRRTRSDLRSMGYKNVDMLTSDNAQSLNAESIERYSVDDEYAAYDEGDGGTGDESQTRIWVTECYLKVDYDGDGISELRKVVRAGNEILDNVVVDVVPFAAFCPVPLAHKFYGLSIADLGFDGQLTKTALLRAKVDNTFLQVNGRYFAVDGQVNLDDLISSRPGGVVRVKQPGAVGRLDQGASDGSADGMLEYMDGFLEASTGWTRNSQGNGPGRLQGTATGMNIVTNKDDMRLDLIARNFAEGFCDMFKLMLKLVCQHQQQETEIRLNGDWININPSEWRDQYDTTINVGLGVGNKDQRIQQLMAMAQRQMEGMQIGVATPENVYAANIELAKEMGFKSGDKFFTDPSKAPPQQPAPDPEQMKAQAQMQIEQAKLQASGQIEQSKMQAGAQIEQMKMQQAAQLDKAKREHEMQLEQMKMQMQAQVDNNRQQAEAQQKTLEIQQQAELDRMKMQHEFEHRARQQECDQWKARLDAETKVLVAQIGAQKNEVETPEEQMTEQGEEPSMNNALAMAMQGFTEALNSMNRPKQIMRGPDGRVQGIM